MKRRPLLSISVVALSMGMITGAGIVNASKCMRGGRDGQFQRRHPPAS